MKPPVRLLVAAAIGVVLVAFVKRPVKPPAPRGSWHPAESQPTRR